MTISEEQFKAAEEIVAAYKAQQNNYYIIKTFPSDVELDNATHRAAMLEAQSVRSVAWCYHRLGAKWMMEEIKKRGAIVSQEEPYNKISIRKDKKYYYNSKKGLWCRITWKGFTERLTVAETEIMLRNTIAGHWLANDKFEERTDFRTWITNEACV